MYLLSNNLPKILLQTSALLAVIVLSACASNKPYSEAAPGLTEVSHNRYFDRVLLAPGTPFPSFNRVYVEVPQVTMNDYWLRNYRGDYTQRDLERIKTAYAELLQKSLREGITEQEAFTLVDSAADADIIFRPKLDALNLYAPDLSFHGRIDHYIHEAGNATFDLQLVDAASGKVLAQFVDHSETFSNPASVRERANRATNARYFGRLMDRWTNNLMAYLTEENSFGTAP